MLHKQEPAYMLHKALFSGPWKRSTMVPKRKSKEINQSNVPMESGTFLLPEGVYEGPLSITKDKFADLQVLKRFYSAKAAKFFEELPHM